MNLPNRRDRFAEEISYLNVCHRTQKHRELVINILFSEDFFDASNRHEEDYWEAFYKTQWEKISGKDIIIALRDHLAELQNEQCCYCRDVLLKGGYCRPIEHILPRVHYPRFSFHFWNVAVSCERCNRLKKATGYELIPNNSLNYPDHRIFTDYFHPRYHVHDEHILHYRIATHEYNYVIFSGRTLQGRSLVKNLLIDVAREMTRESTDPNIRDEISTIRKHASGESEETQKALSNFQAALRNAIEIGAS